MSAAHAALSDQATQAAARRPIPPTPRPRFLVPFATTITLQHPLFPSYKAAVTTTPARAKAMCASGFMLCFFLFAIRQPSSEC